MFHQKTNLFIYNIFIAIFLLLCSCSPTKRFTRPSRSSTNVEDTYSRKNKKRTKRKQNRNYLSINEGKMMDIINGYIGIPYKWGGMSYSGMDCSGFVKKVYKKSHGINLPHNSKKQSNYGDKVARRDMKLGDLIFFRVNFFKIDHVGIYIGEGRFAHASISSGVVISKLNDPYYNERFAFAKRLFYK